MNQVAYDDKTHRFLKNAFMRDGNFITIDFVRDCEVFYRSRVSHFMFKLVERKYLIVVVSVIKFPVMSLFGERVRFELLPDSYDAVMELFILRYFS